MSRVWFTSDLHFQHGLLAAMRSYSSIGEHDEWIVETWNAHVHPGDQVWVLGDVGMGSPSGFLPIVARLNGIKHLVAGNHDQVWPGHREAHRHIRRWLEVFESVAAFGRRRVGEHRVLMSHFPYVGDGGPDRHTQFRLVDQGVPLLHGHTHAHDAESFTGGGTLQVHVGWDAWRRPAPLEEIKELLDA